LRISRQPNSSLGNIVDYHCVIILLTALC